MTMANSVPYIGSRMNLISKAEIRYEGFLHEIDTQATTVTLKNVRSFGTEGRRADKVIGPKDDVFQYIIFRGTDIKDISVCEGPVVPPFADPAIVQSGPPASGRPQQGTVPSSSVTSMTPDATSPTPSFPPFAMPAMSQAKSHPPSVPSPQLFRDATQSSDSQHISPDTLADQGRSMNSNTDHNQSRGNNQRPNMRGGGGGGGYRNDRGDNNRSYSAVTNRQQFNRGYNNEYAPRSYTYNPAGNPYNNSYGNNGFNRNNNTGASSLNSGDRVNNRPMGQQNRNNYNNYQNNYRWNQGGMNRRMGPRNRDDTTGTGDLKIDEDFDIDDANRKFDKSQLVKEFAGLNVQEEAESEAQVHNLADLEEGEVGDESQKTEAAKFYDKSKSFFDSISCDALEKKTARLTTAEEKRLNLQTFGAPSVIRNRPPGPHNYNNSGGFRPRSAGNFHGGDNGGGNNYNRRGNYYGGFNNNAPNYRRGPGNSYYTSNYNNHHQGGHDNNRQQHQNNDRNNQYRHHQQQQRQNNYSHNQNNQAHRVNNPAQA
ncbi:protein LSM14 homolog car-1-like isoform X3 [Symsagittifera roscoffensis]|uniref:protein LSM14 homolog car-1-like isoform X3 n=1 Tax=Symsagittifera roscoffensis TaxID=84072 RepID=UPI00307CA4EB